MDIGPIAGRFGKHLYVQRKLYKSLYDLACGPTISLPKPIPLFLTWKEKPEPWVQRWKKASAAQQNLTIKDTTIITKGPTEKLTSDELEELYANGMTNHAIFMTTLENLVAVARPDLIAMITNLKVRVPGTNAPATPDEFANAQASQIASWFRNEWDLDGIKPLQNFQLGVLTTYVRWRLWDAVNLDWNHLNNQQLGVVFNAMVAEVNLRDTLT